MNNKNILFLIGAGASFGAGSILPERPPLGYQLFDELEKNYPHSWGKIPEKIKEVFKIDFEKGMKIIWVNYSHSVAELMQNMSDYFIQFRPINNSSLFCKLAIFLKSKREINDLTFTSLNYDIILELSLLNNGFNINYFFETGKNKGDVNVYKIHGSSNFTATGLSAGKGVSYGSGAVFEGGIEAKFNVSDIIKNNLVDSGLAPVMSLYMEGKPVNVSPKALKNIHENYEVKSKESDLIFILGIKPLEHDNHIWQSIINSKANIFYIGSEKDFKYFKIKKRKAVFLGDRFNSSFNKLKKIINENI